MNHVAAVGMSPADAAPGGCVRVPLIPEVIKTCAWIVRGSTWIVHPAVRAEEVRSGSPLIKEDDLFFVA